MRIGAAGMRSCQVLDIVGFQEVDDAAGRGNLQHKSGQRARLEGLSLGQVA